MSRTAVIAVILAGFWVSACAATTSTSAPASPAASETSIASEAPTLAASASATPEPSVLATPAATPPPQHTPVPRPLPSVSLKPGQTPLPSPIDISAFLTAQVSVLSLGDAALAVKVSFLDPDSGEGGEAASFTLNTLDIDAEPVPAGVYLVTFTRASGSTAAIKCTLHVKEGDGYSFVATDQRIVVLKDGKLAKKTAEQTVQTSSLCAAS